MNPLIEIHSASEPLLVVENVSVRRNRTNVLNDVNLKVYPGEFIGIVGPNGGGKSTLIQAILGILKCQSGQILLAANRPMSKAVYGKVIFFIYLYGTNRKSILSSLFYNGVNFHTPNTSIWNIVLL